MCRPLRADDLVVLLVGLGLEMVEDPLVRVLGHAVERVEVKEVDELLVLDEPLFALRQPFGDLLGQGLLARHELGIPAEEDVGAAAGHVGRNRDRALAPGLRHEFRFLRVVLRVQHDVLVHAAAGRGAALQAAPIEHRRQPLGFLDRHGADQDRPPLGVLVHDLGDDRIPLFLFGPVRDRGSRSGAAPDSAG